MPTTQLTTPEPRLTPLPAKPNGRPAKLHHELVLLAAGLLLSVLASLGLYRAYVDYTPQDGIPDLSDQSHSNVYRAAQQYCSFTAHALRCQVISTGTTSKYLPPAELGSIVDVQPSPDGSKLLVETAANILNVNDTSHVFITDRSFKTIREVPFTKGSRFTSLGWADANHTVAVGKQSDTGGSNTKLSLYNSQTQRFADVAYQTDNTLNEYLLSGGDFVLLEERTANKPSLQILSLKDHSLAPINTATIADKLQSYTVMRYDATSNSLYIAGSDQAGKQVLVIARLAGTTQPRVLVTKVIDDGAVYTPLAGAAGGMLVSQQKPGQTASYGSINDNGVFTSRRIKPSTTSQFGLPLALTLTPAANTNIEASDYLIAPADTPAPLKDYLTGLVNDQLCPANSYNTVSLLAHDDSTAAVLLAACGGQPALLNYYRQQADGGYSKIGSSLGTPLCGQVAQLELSDTVAPSCMPLQ